MDQYSSFIDALGRELGIDIQLSPTGAAHFVIDGYGLLIQWTESRHAFVVYAEVGRLSGWRDGEVVKELMAANFLLLGSLGGALSLDLSKNMVGLCYQIPVYGMTPEDFVKAIDGIVTQAGEWRGTLARMSAEQERLVAQEQSAIEPAVPAADDSKAYDIPVEMTMLRV